MGEKKRYWKFIDILYANTMFIIAISILTK